MLTGCDNDASRTPCHCSCRQPRRPYLLRPYILIHCPFSLLSHYTPSPAVLKLQESEPPTPRDNIRRNILAPPRADANTFPETKTHIIEMPTATQNQKGALVLFFCVPFVAVCRKWFAAAVPLCDKLCCAVHMGGYICTVFTLFCDQEQRMEVNFSMFSHYADQ